MDEELRRLFNSMGLNTKMDVVESGEIFNNYYEDEEIEL